MQTVSDLLTSNALIDTVLEGFRSYSTGHSFKLKWFRKASQMMWNLREADGERGFPDEGSSRNTVSETKRHLVFLSRGPLVLIV